MNSSCPSAWREPAGVRRAEHGVAGDGHEAADPPGARRVDLLGERGRGKLAVDLGQAADAAREAAEADAASRAGDAGRVPRAGRRLREHRAALAIEVAGQHVEHVDEPARERAELLRAGADASVDRGALRGREIAGDAADDVGREAGQSRATASGVNGRARRSTSARPAVCSARRPSAVRRSAKIVCTIAKRR